MTARPEFLRPCISPFLSDLLIVNFLSSHLVLDTWHKKDENPIAQVKPKDYEKVTNYLTQQKNTANFMHQSHF